MSHTSVYYKNPHEQYNICSCNFLHTFDFFIPPKSSMLIIDIITVISDRELAKINGLSFDDRFLPYS